MIMEAPQTDDTKRLNAILQYVCFVTDNSPKNREDVTKFDLKRKALHDAVAETYKTAPCYKGKSTDEIKDQLYGLDDIETYLADNKDIFPKPTDVVEYLFYLNQDKINQRTSGPNQLETEYALKDWIDGAIARIRKSTKPRIEQCERITNAYRKACDEYNKNLDYRDEKYCKKSFDHQRNDAWYQIQDCFNTMRTFAELPREAYLKKATQDYFYNNAERIYKLIDELRANAFECLMYWKHESNFWDPTFDF